MTATEVLMVVSTLLGPVLAVQAQKWIERARARRDAQQRIFRMLMATRATRVSPDHVQALNMIDLEFGAKTSLSRKDRNVVEKWREYADHLNSEVDNKNAAAVQGWLTRQDDLFVDLLEALAKALNYEFNRVQLRRGVYHPRAHTIVEQRSDLTQDFLLEILSGKRSFPMEVRSFPVSEDAVALQSRVMQGFADAFDESGALRVKDLGDRGLGSKQDP